MQTGVSDSLVALITHGADKGGVSHFGTGRVTLDDGCHICWSDRADLGDKERLGWIEMLSWSLAVSFLELKLTDRAGKKSAVKEFHNCCFLYFFTSKKKKKLEEKETVRI